MIDPIQKDLDVIYTRIEDFFIQYQRAVSANRHLRAGNLRALRKMGLPGTFRGVPKVEVRQLKKTIRDLTLRAAEMELCRTAFLLGQDVDSMLSGELTGNDATSDASL